MIPADGWSSDLWIVGSLMFLIGCGPPVHTGAAAQSVPASTSGPAAPRHDAIAFVQALVTGETAPAAGLIDQAFAADAEAAGLDEWRDPETLWQLAGIIPADCTPVWSQAEGYTNLAIPPPMVEDSDERAARIQRVIDGLVESVEVQAVCSTVQRWTECEDDPDTGEKVCDDLEETVDVVRFVVAVHRRAGAWRVRAWRDLLR